MPEQEWINPKYADALAAYGPITFSNGESNCPSCHGLGRTIYADPSDGSYKDIPCVLCAGSGRSSL